MKANTMKANTMNTNKNSGLMASRMKSSALARILGALVAFGLVLSFASPVFAKKSKTRFYDFSDQLIDGEVKKPSTMYIDTRMRAKFQKLLSLKKSFRQAMIDSSKEPILK